MKATSRHWTFRARGFEIIVGFLFSLWSTSAEAVVVKLYYNPAGAHACCTDVDSTTRVILQAAREYEAHSYGAIQFDWKGVTNVVLDGSDNRTIQIGWQNLGPPSNCGSTWTPGSGFVSGQAMMNLVGSWRLTPTLNGVPQSWQGQQCIDLRSNITHELDHFFRPGVPNNNHPIDSVLIDNVTWADLWSRNLWNDDIGGISQQYFPRRPVALSVDVLQSLESVNNAGGTIFSGGANHTGALGPGGAVPGGTAYNYARVFTDLGVALWFEQGDGYGANWGVQRQVGSGQHPTTFHRACIATNTVNANMIVAWASSTQARASIVGSVGWAGSREIVYVESADGGSSFSGPFTIAANTTPTARTRTGISCAFDLQNMRFVLIYADDQEVLKVTSRITSVGALWSMPANLASVGSGQLRTGEAPTLSFDPMDWDPNHLIGLVSWWDTDVNDQRSMWIRWNATQGQYLYNSGYLISPVLPAQEALLRTSLALSVNSGVGHWGYGTQLHDQSARWRGTQPYFGAPNFNSLEFWNNSSTGYFDWYVGASANRMSFSEKSYLRHIAYL